jgi:hypothetical protein
MNRVKMFRVCLLPFVLALAACSDMDPGNQTFSTVFPNLATGGSGGDGGEGPTGAAGTGGTAGSEPVIMPREWQCMTEPDMPLENPGPGSRVTYLTPIVDFDSPSPTSPLPVPNVEITACITPACDPPAACWPNVDACDPDIGAAAMPPSNSPVRIVQPNPTAAPFLFAVDLPWGYDSVSIRVRAVGYVPSEYFLGGPMTGAPEGGLTVVGLPYFLLKDTSLNTLYGQVGLDTPWDKARGILAVRTINCDRAPTPFNPDPDARQATRGQRVQVELDGGDPEPPAAPWVLSFGKQARGKRLASDVLLTDDRGTAGFASLDPGFYGVRGIAPAPVGAAEGMRYGETGATVRAGVISIVEVRDGIGIWGQ